MACRTFPEVHSSGLSAAASHGQSSVLPESSAGPGGTDGWGLSPVPATTRLTYLSLYVILWTLEGSFL